MRIHTLCKRLYNHEYVEDIGIGLVIDSFTYKKAGYVKEWELCFSDGESVIGRNIQDLVDTLKQISYKYSLEKRSDFNKDTIIIYTDDLTKAFGFLHNYDENISFFEKYYFTFLDVFEFRDISIWFEDCNSAKDIAEHAQVLLNQFGEEKYFYITPTQCVTKKIKKRCDSTIAEELFPQNVLDYQSQRKAYFGGICVANCTGLIIDDFITAEYDRKSAYIYDLLCEKHLCEPLRHENISNYRFFIENHDKYFAILTIKIKHISGIKRAAYFIKNLKGKHLEEDKPTTVNILNTDLYLLEEKLCKVFTYEVIDLVVGKKDYLPRYIAEVIEEEYAKKVMLERSGASKAEIDLQKIRVNSIYGATVKRILGNFVTARDNAFLTPQWGMQTSAYARYNLLSVALEVRNWLYSDTDCVFCEDCLKNARIIDDFNDKCRTIVMMYCMKNGLDFDIYKDLGQFKLKHKIKKIKILGKKTYMYTTTHNDFVLKASGITYPYGEEAYTLNKLKSGKKVLGEITDEKTSCVIDGIEFVSYGSYYDKNVDGDSFEFLGKMYVASLIKRRTK